MLHFECNASLKYDGASVYDLVQHDLPGSLSVIVVSTGLSQGRSALASYVVEGVVVETYCTMGVKNLPNSGSLAVFRCSMAGDSCNTVISTDQLDIDCMLDIDRLVVDRMMKTVTSLVDFHNVQFIICQKVTFVWFC
jgi:hypothetical protein